MKKTKKILSGLLAVLMLVSMLACFTLPAVALDGNQTVYYVTGRTQWRQIVGLVNDDPNNFAGKTIYFMTDIDMGGGWPSQIGKFAGTIDGNGYSFTNVASNKAGIQDKTAGVTMVEVLKGGTIKNLTFDSTCVFTATAAAHTGAFVAQSEGGTISNCAFLGTYNATSSDSLGAFVGYAKKNDANSFDPVTTLEGCVFGGTLNGNTASSKYTGAFVGRKQGAAAAVVQLGYCVAKGTLSGSGTGMVCNGATVKNSYSVGGMNDYVNATTKDFQKNDIKEAVWTINDARATAEKDGVYINVDTADVPYIGSANNRVVKGTTVNGTTTTTAYYAPRAIVDSSKDKESTQNYFTPATVTGKTPIVTGAEYIDGVVYIDHSDFTIEYVDEAVKLRSDLQAMVNAYNAMDQKRFSTWSNVTTWLTAAQGVLDNASATATQLQEQITAEASVDAGYTKAGSEKNYPSIAEYNTYKYVDTITDYKVGTKDEWLTAVEISNYVSNPNAVNFTGVKIHMTADIDMENTPMLPLCYSYVFDGNFDGHDKVFKNINIVADNPYGPVALFGVVGLSKRSITRVGIESGTITVTGMPRYKRTPTSITDVDNKVAGIVGKTLKGATQIKKCWNNANITAENVKEAAGIVADPRTGAVIVGCFNLGKTGMYGIAGYGANKAKVYNSMSGGSQSGVMIDAPNTTISTYLVNVKAAVNGLAFNGSPDADQKAAMNTYNAENTAMNNAEVAWRTNMGYTQYASDSQIYYTLNENGEVRFGSANDQVYRVKLVCHEHGASCTTHPVAYTYGGTTTKITVDFDFDANYYASADEKVTIKGNTIQFENGVTTVSSSGEDAMTFEVKVGHNADRGNANGSADGKINVLDALAIVKMVVKPATANVLTSDLNNNYAVDINDAYEVVRYVFGNKEKVSFLPGKVENRRADYLKVASYNIKSFHYDPTQDGNNSATAMAGYNKVMKEIDALNASGDQLDVITFQEIDRYNDDATLNGSKVDQLQLLANRLGITYDDQHAIFTITIPDTTYNENGGYGNGIISRHTILEHGIITYDDKYLNNDPTQGITGSETRGFTWAKLDINASGAYEVANDIIFVGFHFSNPHEAQVEYMIDYMNANFPGHRIVCGGDVNRGPYGLEGAVNADTFTAVNGGKNFDKYTITNAHSGSLVDNIFVSNNLEYYQQSLSETGLYNRLVYYNSSNNIVAGATGYDKTNKIWSASDHSPIYTYIKVK